MQLPWLFGARPRGRRARKAEKHARPGSSGALRVRQLERRRVLDAATASLVVPTSIEVGQESTLSSPETTVEPLVFDWAGWDAGNEASGTESAVAVRAFMASSQGIAPSDGLQAFEAANSLPAVIAANNQVVQEDVELDLSGGPGKNALALVADLDLEDDHKAVVDWGDGQGFQPATEVLSVIDGGIRLVTFGGTQTYTNGGADYTVTIRAADNSMGAYADPSKFDTGTLDVDFVENSFVVTVLDGENNLPVVVAANDQEVQEGDTLDLSGGPGKDSLAFVGDLDVNDTHTAVVDWGDGSGFEPAQIVNSQVFEGTLFLTLGGTHVYADGGASFIEYTVTVRVADNYMSGNFQSGEDGVDFVEDTFTVKVLNAQNSLPVVVAANPQHVFEGDVLDLSGEPGKDALAFVGDLDENDTHLAVVDWGDGSGFEPATIVDSQVVDGTLFLTLGGTHIYVDGGGPFSEYTVTVRVADNNMSGDFENGLDGVDFVQDTFVVKVFNAAPTVTDVDLSAAAIFEGDLLTVNGTFDDPALGVPTETFIVEIDWGNGDISLATVNNMTGQFTATYLYKDDHPTTGTPQDQFTINITITDDDGGSFTTPPEAGADRQVTVKNVPPAFINTIGATINENSTATISAVIIDPGTPDVFSVVVNWQDGVSDTIDLLGLTNIDSTTVGGTTYTWDAASRLLTLSHHYDDDNPTGTPSDAIPVSLIATDDDTGVGGTAIVVVLNNVPPEELTFTVSDPDLTIQESESVSIAGSFTDTLIGFASEDFRAFVLWGDGTSQELTLNISASQVSFGDLTHTFADNNPNNISTIRLRVADDDMAAFAAPDKFVTGETGVDFVEFTVDLTVLNVNPTLDPLTATDVESTGRATVTLSFSDPGADTFQVLVDWGDKLHLPPAERFVVETLHAGSTPANYTLEHFYTGPPDPLNPAADILISVVIHDDDAAIAGVVQPGISNIESIAVANPGIDTDTPKIDTTPRIPRIEFLAQPAIPAIPSQSSGTIRTLLSADFGASSGQTAATSKRFLELVAIAPDGSVIDRYELKEEELADLRKLFAKLPDGRYQIFLVRTDTSMRRLVMDVYVRRGILIDPQDDSEGTRDRPPTRESEESNEAAAEPDSTLEPSANADGDNAAATPLESPPEAPVAPSYTALRWSTALAGVAIAAGGSRWSKEVDAALARADRRTWQRLRRAARLGRVTTHSNSRKQRNS